MPLLADRFADQQLVRRNKALAENHLNGIPIRVHRGQAHVPDMPESSDIGMTAFTMSQDTDRNAAKTALRSGVFASRKPRLPNTQRK